MSDHHIEMDYQSVHHHYNSEVYKKVGSGKCYVSPIFILYCVWTKILMFYENLQFQWKDDFMDVSEYLTCKQPNT